MRDYRKLDVWRRAHELTLKLYDVTRNFPSAELYGLTSQIRRAAASIPANIAEGYGRESDPEFARYLDISIGSSSELSYHLLLSRDLGYIEHGSFQRMRRELGEIQHMLSSLKLKVSKRK